MPDWLTNAFTSDLELSTSQELLRLGAALGLGVAISMIYQWTKGRAGIDRSFLATLVLLTVLLSLTTLVIGNNVARAFSIVGVLSIVRFRTVVEDTRDTTFVVAAVALGMAAGAGYFVVPVLALPFIAVAARLFAGRGSTDASTRVAYLLRVRANASSPEAIARLVEDAAPGAILADAETLRGGTVVERRYEVALAGDAAAEALLGRLGSHEAIQSVAIERIRGGR